MEESSKLSYESVRAMSASLGRETEEEEGEVVGRWERVPVMVAGVVSETVAVRVLVS